MTKSSDATDSAPVILHLGAAEADLATGTLRHPDGTETLLRPKSADVLRVLAARRGEVVTKQALMDAVWGDVSVTEDGLVQCVGDIRRGLSDDDHRLVRTVPRQGYMLAADAPAPAPGRRPWAPGRRAVALVSGVVALCALLVFAAMAMPWRQAPSDDRPTIAVLPFENLTDDPRWTRLGRGLSTDIASALAHHRQISVIGAETAHAARDGDPVAAGRRIGAHFLLLGSIRPLADGLRIDARMIDAQTGRLEWSESWTRDGEDLFAIQDEIVARSASGLVAQFWFGAVNEALARKARAKPPGSLSAYEAYLLGIENILWKKADYETALTAFHRAVALDPAFGAAWAMIGVMKQWIADVSPPEARDGLLAEAHAAYRQAALYQPNDAMIQVLASNVALHDGDLDACRDAILRGVDLAPNLPDVLAAAAWQAMSCDVKGATAQGWAERAIALNPEGPPWHRIGLAQAALSAGDLDTAIRALSAAPPHHKRFVILAATRWNQGRIDAARRAAAELLMAFPDYSLASEFGPGPHSRALAEVIDAAARAGVPLTAPEAE